MAYLKVCLVAWLVIVYPALSAARDSERIIYQKDSLYQQISVVEDVVKRERYILTEKRSGMQGGISLDAPGRLIFEYYQMSFAALGYLDAEPKEVLFIGLGAGAMPRYFNRLYPEANIDIVEIDPEIVNVAKGYFYFQENPKMRIHINDGRIFIKRTPKKYDLIFLDAYKGSDIPFHLTTREFMREVKSKLREGGVVASNIVYSFRNRLFDSLIVTYNKEFPHLYIYKGKGYNTILVATKNGKKRSPREVMAHLTRIQSTKRIDFDLCGCAQICEYAYSTEYNTEAKVLTDDFAPVNLYQYTKSGS